MTASRVLRAVAALGAVLAGLAVVPGAPPASAATNLPSGFADVPVANIGAVTSLTPLADGRVLVTTQGGTLATINPATLGVTPMSAAGLAVCSNSERGLLGAAQDPTNPANVFLYYTASNPCRNRVVRYTLSGNALTNPVVILDNIPSQSGTHNGGDLHVGKDGFLYITVGDSGCDPRGNSGCAASNNAAQDLGLLSGKILRVTTNGDPAPGNPFAGAANSVPCKAGSAAATQICREIYAYGLRNPFRIAPDPNAPGVRFFINDVGQNQWEEIDDLVAGANYGWPCREGPAVRSAPGCPVPGPLKDPFHGFTHATGCRSITGGAFVPNGAWPGYDGTYLYADFGCGTIFTLSAACGGQWQATPLATGGGPITELQFVGEQLWYASYNGQIRRILPPPHPAGGPTSRLVTVPPVRKLDTRIGLGAPAGPVPAGGTRTVNLAPQVPAGAVAALVNITITQASAPGFVTAWPANQPRPFTSTLNVTAPGQTVPNTALVAVSPSSGLSLFTLGGGHLIVDVYGYFLPSGATSTGRYAPLNPTRLFDTRLGHNAPAGRVNGRLDVPVLGRNGVPSTGVAAVALVLTGTQPAGSSFVTAWPAGGPFPPTSVLNLNGPADTRANLVVVPVGANGRISVFANSPTHLLADVAGWFTGPGAGVSGSGLFVPTTPQRALDTREPGRPASRLVSMRACNLGLGWAVPDGAAALAANLTAVSSASSAFLSAFPGGTAWPGVSNLNTTKPGDIVAAQAITRFGAGQSVALLANVATDVVVDVTGWFTG